MFPPSATQSSSRRLAAAEARAGVAEAQGTYRPRLTSPSTGPPRIRAANDPSVYTITEKAPGAFSWLKVPSSAFTFKHF